ncbi:MAG: methionyl-tRNA formyltransferase [Chloroflexota bacterium]
MTLAVVMECLFSVTFLAELSNRGIRPRAVVIAHPDSTRFVPVVPRHNLLQTHPRVDDWCHQHGIPLYRVYRWSSVPDVFLEQFSSVVIACFPRLLPAQRFFRLGIDAWNVHPSALPNLRGPDPLFYTARGDAPAAITIHLLDETYDTGPVLGREYVAEPTVMNEHTYIETHARSAAALVQNLRKNPPIATPQQSDAPATWAGMPQTHDYTLDSLWTMARVRRFVALTDQRGHPYWVPESRQWVRHLSQLGDITIRCADGMLRGVRSSIP